MRNFLEITVKILMAFTVIAGVSACKESSDHIPLIKFEHVSEFTRDSYRSTFEWKGMYDRLSMIQYYVGDTRVSEGNVLYTDKGMNCYVDTLMYEVELGATIGGSRAFKVRATRGGGLLYSVEYQYDREGRLGIVGIMRPGEADKWIYYTYPAEDSIVINEFDGGDVYTVRLSKEVNTGYVCNVLAFAEAPLTNKYVINPELYFLNIYGKPIEYLPVGETVQRIGNNDNRLSRVGKYYYKYE
jgi:hypothetical protein